MKRQLLYHVSTYPKMTDLSPRVPSFRLKGEDDKTPRICLAPSVLNCFRAIPGGNCFLPLMLLQGAYFGLYTIDLSQHPEVDFKLVQSDLAVAKQHDVPDQQHTHEWWVRSAIRIQPQEFRLIHVDGCTFSKNGDLLKSVTYHQVSETDCAQVTAEALMLDYKKNRAWALFLPTILKMMREDPTVFAHVLAAVMFSSLYKHNHKLDEQLRKVVTSRSGATAIIAWREMSHYWLPAVSTYLKGTNGKLDPKKVDIVLDQLSDVF